MEETVHDDQHDEHSAYRVAPNIHLDAAAMLAAHVRGDADGISSVLDANNPVELARVLVQHLASAVRSPKMTIAEWVDLQAEKTIDAMYDDEELGE
jgi:hypothetical protein